MRNKTWMKVQEKSHYLWSIVIMVGLLSILYLWTDYVDIILSIGWWNLMIILIMFVAIDMVFLGFKKMRPKKRR